MLSLNFSLGIFFLRIGTRGSLYFMKMVSTPLPLAAWSSKPPNKSALAAIKPSMVRWHYRLGHASSPIVQRVVHQNSLSCLKEKVDASVCDACQKSKSHQLSFPKSLSVSHFPLALVFSDVLGPAPSSVGNFKYYVSFIDDYSKFLHRSHVDEKIDDDLHSNKL
jgi:hypothetical protein